MSGVEFEDAALVVRAAVQLRREGRPDRAESVLRLWLHSDAFNTAALYELSLALLAQGRFSEAWPLFERRLATRPTPSLPYPRWRGESVRERSVLVVGELFRAEQVVFLPFVSALPERGANTTFICSADLATQLSAVSYAVIPMGGEVEFADPDIWIMQGSIPGIVGGGTPEISAWARSV